MLVSTTSPVGAPTLACHACVLARAQSSCIKIWGGKDDKYKAAQDQLLARAQANSEASKGEYKPGSQPSIEESLFVKNYAY